MLFEWDDAKSEACWKDRGFDFSYASNAFFDPARQIHQDIRHSYGETRFQLMGMIEGRLFVVIYTARAQGIRIISARKANSREVQRYENRKTAN